MKKQFWLAMVAVAASLAFFYLTSQAATPPPIQTQPTTPVSVVSVIVYLKDQADVQAIRGASRAEQRRNVTLALHSTADATQGSLISLLEARRSQGLVQSFTSLWIINAIALTADRRVVDELTRLPQVSRIVPDEITAAPPQPAPAPRSHTLALAAAAAITPEWNISIVNAPAMWALGFRGQGIVVASMDSGVDDMHPDLQAQWRGGNNSWYDPYNQHATPWDNTGHGTQTMGVIVGDGFGGTAIGMAPDARWIAVKIYNDAGQASDSKIHQGFQWLLDPDGNPNTDDAPDVVNNSWDRTNAGCDLLFEPDVQALIAARITPVFAAGNSAKVSFSPANDPGALSVGSIDINDQIANDSAYTMTTCGGVPSHIFPDMVAPGVGIYTTDLYDGFITISYTTQSGTSLAAPHVAGALALLLSANPSLTVSSQVSALLSTAIDLGSPGPDIPYGYGRLDVLAAYHWLMNEADVSLAKTASAAAIKPGDVLTYTLIAANTGPVSATQVVVTDSLPLSLSLRSMSAGCSGSTIVTCTLGTLEAGMSHTLTITVQTDRLIQAAITNTATVTSTRPDPLRANNTAFVSTVVYFHRRFFPIVRR